MSTVLALAQVTKRYRWKGPWVLAGADLTLDRGTSTAIAGDNGSGKSTLLRIAAGVTSPSGGRAAVPHRVGYTPERQAARCPFTARQYLFHMGRLRGLDAPSIAAGTDELLGRFDVRPGRDVSWNTLSKGNRQKVVLAQAFLGRPDLIVLDEPDTGLDDGGRDVLGRLMTESTDAGSTVLISRHAQFRTAETTHRYRLVAGRLVADEPSTPEALAPGAPWRRIELSPPDRRTPPDDLTRLEGVRSWAGDASASVIVLIVAAGYADDVLRAALHRGWSVRAVGPGPGPGPEGEPA